MNNNFGKKIRKRLRFLSIFNCCYARQKDENSQNEFKNSNLQILLLKTLQTHVEDREFHLQLKQALICLTSVLEQFMKNSPTKSLVILKQNSLTQILPTGNFCLNETYLQSDKSVQSTLITPNTSKIIQTQNFNLNGFKINLIEHMRTLKQDVLILKQLLCSVDNNMRIDRSLFYKAEECEIKFFQAKLRAANFVKFYKLRNIDEKKKNYYNKRRRNKIV